MKANILVTMPMSRLQKERLKAIAPECEFRFIKTTEMPAGCAFEDAGEEEDRPLSQEDVAWAEIIMGNVHAEMINASEKLLWFQTNSAGVEPYINGALAKNTVLTNATGAYGLAISEHMLGMLLEIIKKLQLYRDAQHKEGWESMGAVTSIYNSTVLVLGMGDIGGEFGARCKALGAKVIGVRRANTAKPDYADEVHLIDELDELLPRADVVAITLPGTEATKNLIDRERIGKMKDGAVLLNVGRGYIVDTDALCDALESGKLAGAGLDVTEPEPLPAGHRLWHIPTAVITPHISGFYHLRETHTRIVNIFTENLRRFMNGEELINTVDFATGYRKLK